MVIMSDGLYQSLTDATGREQVNGDIAKMVASEFSQQTTLTGVAQAVVDRVVRIHHDTFMEGPAERRDLCKKRDDITLLVRNFNYPLSTLSPSSVRSLSSPSHPQIPSHFPHEQTPTRLSATLESPSSDSPQTPTNMLVTGPDLNVEIDSNITSYITTNGSGHYSTNSSEFSFFHNRNSNDDKLELDADGKVSFIF